MEEEKPNCGSSQSVEYLSVKFTWKIANFSKLSAEKLLHSEIFNAGGYKWRILIYPKGNKNAEFLSVYLDVADSKTLANGWSRDAKFSFSVISEANRHTMETEHEFNAEEPNWGFSSFVNLKKLEDPKQGYLVNDTCTLILEVSGAEEGKEKTDSDTEKNSSPFSEFDTLYSNIQNILETNTTNANDSYNFSPKEISDAETIFQHCLDMDIMNVILSGKAPELKNSLYILLTTKAFPMNMFDRTSKIVSELVQSCSSYEVARQDLSEARENESSVLELKRSLKQLSAYFAPMRYQAEAVDKEIVQLEKKMTEKREKKELLGKKLKEFTTQAITSKEALVCAEDKMRSSTIKRKRAEMIIEEFERSWEFLKALRFTRA